MEQRNNAAPSIMNNILMLSRWLHMIVVSPPILFKQHHVIGGRLNHVNKQTAIQKKNGCFIL